MPQPDGGGCGRKRLVAVQYRRASLRGASPSRASAAAGVGTCARSHTPHAAASAVGAHGGRRASSRSHFLLARRCLHLVASPP